MNEQIEHRLKPFHGVTLEQLNRVRLQNRVDTKFLLNQRTLLRALDNLRDEYFLLVVNNTPLNRYYTLYFDTPDFGMYMDHHNGVGNRYKVRRRHYVETDTSFLEVKHKTNTRRTIKFRQETNGGTSTDESVLAGETKASSLSQKEAHFLHSAYPGPVEILEPKLENSFIRITFASKTREERLTIDLGLIFEVEGIQVSFPDIVVAEVKQSRFSVNSVFFKEMRKHQVRRIGFSKYCAGIARMYPQIKHNQFKERLLVLNRLSGLNP